MRLKSFEATDMNEAMRMIRDSMGEDAVIISTTRLKDSKRVKVTAAIEVMEEDDEVMLEVDDPLENIAINVASDELQPRQNTTSATTSEAPAPAMREPAPAMPMPSRSSDASREFAKALHFHNVPRHLAEALCDAADNSKAKKPDTLLTSVLKHHFTFDTAPLTPGNLPIMLIGPPGVGKTITTAKIATEAILHKRPVTVMTTDTNKAGGIEQLQAFTDILNITLTRIKSPKQLTKALAEADKGHLIIIDTAGANPYDSAELKATGALISAADVEPVLVLPAGMDVHEAQDVAGNFAYLGANYLMITKIDAARRYGGILAAAQSGGLALSHISRTPAVADGLDVITPQELTALFLQTRQPEH